MSNYFWGKVYSKNSLSLSKTQKQEFRLTKSARAVESTDCTSAEG